VCIGRRRTIKLPIGPRTNIKIKRGRKKKKNGGEGSKWVGGKEGCLNDLHSTLARGKQTPTALPSVWSRWKKSEGGNVSPSNSNCPSRRATPESVPPSTHGLGTERENELSGGAGPVGDIKKGRGYVSLARVGRPVVEHDLGKACKEKGPAKPFHVTPEKRGSKPTKKREGNGKRNLRGGAENIAELTSVPQIRHLGVRHGERGPVSWGLVESLSNSKLESEVWRNI